MPPGDHPEHHERACVGCHRSLPVEDFPSRGDGTHAYRCGSCEVARRRKHCGKNLDSHLRLMIRESKYRAKKGLIGWHLSLDDLKEMWRDQDGRCAVSGMPLTHHRRGGAERSTTNASLDRIDPRGDYTADNTHLVCAGVNLMRRHLELDEFLVWCRQIADHHRAGWSATGMV